jgi:hypothetical protein
MTEKQNRKREESEERVLNPDLEGVQKASRTDESKNVKGEGAGGGSKAEEGRSAGAPGEKKAKRRGVEKSGAGERAKQASKETEQQASPKAEAGSASGAEEEKDEGAETKAAGRDAGGRFASRYGHAGKAKAAGTRAKTGASGDGARDNLSTEAGQKRLVNKLLGKANTQTFKLSAGDLIRLIQLQKELMENAPHKVTVQWVEDERE